ncbi:BA75_03018T0 [Komagataella pastoris]|uniref:BA75_03018T0 n=1 Tax=Komagataella pastoris TaxID=4922 RepID=A0A1B2JAF0_PICPA|nr:BA75_03018T0 [Komagataella pastoris]
MDTNNTSVFSNNQEDSTLANTTVDMDDDDEGGQLSEASLDKEDCILWARRLELECISLREKTSQQAPASYRRRTLGTAPQKNDQETESFIRMLDIKLSHSIDSLEQLMSEKVKALEKRQLIIYKELTQMNASLARIENSITPTEAQESSPTPEIPTETRSSRRKTINQLPDSMFKTKRRLLD